MADLDARTLLLKFKSDLSTLSENAKSIGNTIKQLSSTLKSERDKSSSEAKKQHEETLRLAKEQTQVQINLIKAKQKAASAETNYEKDLAAAQIKRLNTKAQEIRLQQQLISLKEKQVQLEKGEGKGGEGGISKLLTNFASAASGGGLLGSLVAGAAGGGMFAIFEKLSESIGEVVKKFMEMPTAAGELVENLEKSAARAGVTTKEFQQLKLAAAESDLSSQTLTRALMMMNLQLTRSGAGVSKVEKEFTKFNNGLSPFRDGSGNLLATTDILKNIGDIFNKLPDGMTKSRLAADLFTRRIGSQMIPLLNQGSASIQELYDRSEQYSILVNEDLLKAQRNWQVETAALKMQWEQFQVSIGEGLLPLLVKVLQTINDIVAAMNQTSGVNTPKQFSEDIASWARAQGMGIGPDGKALDLKLSSEGRNKMNEAAPTDVAKNVYKKVFGNQAGGAFLPGTTWGDLYTKLRSGGQDTTDLISQFAKEFPNALEKTEEASRKLDPRLQDNSKSLSRVAMATIKYKEALAQLNEKQEESAIQNKQFDLKNQFDQGTISQETYVSRSKELDKEAFDSKVKYINDWAKLEKEKVQQAAEQQRIALVGDTEIDAPEVEEKKSNLEKETNEKLLIIDVQQKEKLLAAEDKFNKEKQQLNLQNINSDRKSNEIRINENTKVQQEILNNEKSLLEYQLKQRVVTADEYLQKRSEQIREEVDISIRAAQDEYEFGKKTPEALAQLESKRLEARMKGEKELTDLIRNESQTRLNLSEGRYQGFMGLVQSQLSTAQSQPGGSGADAANAAMTRIINLTKNYRNEQTQLLTTVRPFSDEWFKISNNIAKATSEISKMQLELNKAKSTLINVGGIFQQFSSLLTQFGVSRGGFASLGSAGGILNTLGSARAARSTSGKTGGVFSDMMDAFKGFKWGDMATSMQKFNEGIKGAVGAVGGFAQMLGSSHGKAGDIAGGAIGGFGIGGDIGDMFSKFSKFAGPIGQVAGAAFGGILSGIIGHKNNQTQQFINSVNKQMADLQASISNGTLGLQQGIQELQGLRQSVLSEMGHSKKKQKGMLEQEASAINDQIIALQRQQEAMFIDLGNQLKVLNAPTQFQGLLGSLKDIMDQYKKFAGAARDAKDLAMANQFLSDSLRNFAETQQTALNDAEQTAIQDAIKLNDLLRDRQQLLTDEAQTEYDIMTQGVLVNQRTVAMQKMQQIQQARNQMNLELQRIDQDIALTTYKVNSERQIFNLATTRIDLETQLLVLQEAQTDKEMLRIKALQQIVELLNSGKSITNMNDLILALFGSSSSTTTVSGTNNASQGDIEGWLNNIRAGRARGGFSSQIGYLYS